jgi:pimeloyl-[acyl-carrier protein] synthase
LTETVAQFSTFDQAFLANPYPTYEQLRSAGRLLWMGMMGGEVHSGPPEDSVIPGAWILTRYEDCVAFLRDERVSADPRKSQLFQMLMKTMWGEDSPAIQLVEHLLLFMDPPDHTRLRTLANAAFSRRAVEALRPRITEIVKELLGAARERGQIDLVADFAYPFPITVIAEMLGVPMSDRQLFGSWSRDLIDLFGTEDMSTEGSQRGNDAIVALNEYFTGLAEERKKSPRDDLLTAFVEVEEAGERLTHEEFLATCLILLIAGHETTANLIALGTLALLRRPDALEQLRDDPSLVNPGVEELLRYDSPVQATARTVVSPIEIDGTTIPEAERVMVLIGSANHDPDQFAHPENLDFGRSSNPFLSFGGGVHFCLGAPLARLEARAAFSELVKLPLELVTDDLEWRSTFPIRGPKSLPIKVS